MDATPDCSEGRNWQALITAWSLFGLALLLFCLRLWCRPRPWDQPHLRKHYYADDIILVIPLVCSFSMALALVPLTMKGVGLHRQCADPDLPVLWLKMFLLWELQYTIMLASTKLSILLMFRRLFDINAFRKCFWILAIIVAGWTIAVLLVSLFICYPISDMWDHPERCGNIEAFYFGNSIPNILTDAAILACPLWFIQTLNLSVGQKLGLSGAFLCGGLVVLISILRLHVVVTTKLGEDFVYESIPQFCWSLAELNVAIVSACLPTLRPLTAKILSGWQSLSSGHTTNAEITADFGYARSGCELAEVRKYT